MVDYVNRLLEKYGNKTAYFHFPHYILLTISNEFLDKIEALSNMDSSLIEMNGNLTYGFSNKFINYYLFIRCYKKLPDN